jgi:hypothetical protein
MNGSTAGVAVSKSSEEYQALFAKVATILQKNPIVIQPKKKKGFGSSALWIKDGKMFALLSGNNEFVVKLSRGRVDELVESGKGVRFDPRVNGKVMKEWLVVKTTSETICLSLAMEAMEFAWKKK